MAKEALFGKTLNELKEIVQQYNMKPFVAKQIADWLYKKRVTKFEDMRNIAKSKIEQLSNDFCIGTTLPSKVQESKDGTKKYLFPVSDNNFVESAYIPSETRFTLCVSSQVGCRMGCTFCMTGRQGLQQNLSCGQILNQIVSIPEADKLTNLVFMGMGEPLDNYDELIKCLEIITSEWGFAWSPRRINVSSIGLVPNLERLINESEVHIAISLHSPYNEEREKLMPIEKAYPIEDIVDCLGEYDFSKQRRASFEYIMFKGINDSVQHALDLAKLIKHLRARVNIIKFHPIPDSDLQSSSQNSMDKFKSTLESKGIICTIRKSRGEDIYAACGLLSTKNKE